MPNWQIQPNPEWWKTWRGRDLGWQVLRLITFRVIRMGMIYIFVQIGHQLLTDPPLAPHPIEKRATKYFTSFCMWVNTITHIKIHIFAMQCTETSEKWVKTRPIKQCEFCAYIDELFDQSGSRSKGGQWNHFWPPESSFLMKKCEKKGPNFLGSKGPILNLPIRILTSNPTTW